MNKGIREIIKRLPIIGVSVTLVASMLINMSAAEYTLRIGDGMTVNQLRGETRNETWFEFNNFSDVIGAPIKVGQDMSYENVGAYCIDPHSSTSYDKDAQYEVVNIIDINNNSEKNSITVIGHETDENGSPVRDENGKLKMTTNSGIGFDNPDAYPILMLSYLVQKANNIGKPTNTYKDAMARVFWYDSWLKDMQKLGVSKSIKSLADGKTKSSYFTYQTGDNKYLEEAMKAANNLKNQGNLQGQAIINATQGAAKKTTQNGKTYIGPYKLNLIGDCVIGQITVNGINAAGITTSLNSATQGVDSLNNSTGEFYIVVDSEVNEVKEIKVTARDQVTSIRARLMLLGGGATQNFMLYRAEEVNKPLEIKLDLPEDNDWGKIEIIKKDEFDRKLDFTGVEFKIHKAGEDNTENKWVKVEDGKVVYTDFENATPFVTNNKGIAQGLDNLRFEYGRYEIYETKIPDTLSKYYKLPGMTVKNGNGQDIVTVGLKATNEAVISKNNKEGTASVEFINEQAFGKLFIWKQDATTQKDINGIQFKLYKYPVANDGEKLAEEGYWIEIEKTKDEEGNDIWLAKDNKNTTFESAGELTTGITGFNGYTQVVKNLPTGTYAIYETDLGGHTEYPAIPTDTDDPATVEKDTITALYKDDVVVTGAEDPVSDSKAIFKQITNQSTEPQYGTIKIHKVDEFGNIDSLSGIKFRVHRYDANRQELSWIMGVNKNGVATYGDFDSAMEFETDSEGNVPELEKVKVHLGYKYEIFETYIPETLSKYYKLPGMTLKDKDGKDFVTTGEKKATVEVNEADTPCEIENKRAFGDLFIWKRDKDTREDINGIQFKLYKYPVANDGEKLAEEGYWVVFEKQGDEYKYVDKKGTFNEASPMTTGIAGYNGYTQVVKNLPTGTYAIYETDLGGHTEYPAIPTDTDDPATVEKDTITALYKEDAEVIALDTKSSNFKEVENKKVQPEYGTIKITKQDESVLEGSDLEKIDNLSEIGFKILRSDDTKDLQNKWITGIDENGYATFGGFDDALEFKTDTNGNVQSAVKDGQEINLKDVKLLLETKYDIYETSIPNRLKKYYRLPNMTVKINDKDEIRAGIKKETVEVNKSGETPVLITNYRDYFNGKFYIHKTNAKTGEDISGIEFKLYKYAVNDDGTVNTNDGYWVIFENNEAIDKAGEKIVDGTPLVTDKNGLTEEVSHLPLGRYAVFETSLGNNEGKFVALEEITFNGETFTGRLMDDKATGKDYLEIVAKKNDTKITFEGENEPTPTPTDISISGKVWQDNESGKNTNDRNNKLNVNPDYMIEGIVVRLVDSQGNELDRKTTNSNGEYKFEGIKASELGNLHVEFTYDGITYQNIKVGNYDDANASKASEDFAGNGLRNTLNSVFTEITGENQKVTYNGQEITLTYNRERLGDGNLAVTSGNICEREVEDSTVKVSSNKQGDFTIRSATEGNYLVSRYKEGMTEITDVNLGLYEREMPDLTLVKETDNAVVNLNGKSYTYNYPKNVKETKTGTQTTTQVLFGRENPFNDEQIKYDIAIDRAANIDEEDENSGIFITYRVALSNNSTTLNTKVHSINEIFSKDLEFIKIVDENGEELNANIDKGEYDNENKKYVFNNLDIEVSALTSKLLYVTFKLPTDKVYYEDGEINKDLNLMNYAEIASYSVYQNNQLYAGFDTDSIPNNFKIGNRDLDEDDDDKAPTLQIVERGNTSLSGIVFEDLPTQENLANHERIGDGEYNEESESGVENVVVRLVGGTSSYETTTNENGQYSFSNVAPGTYKVQFEWGEGVGDNGSVIKRNGEDIKVTVNDYKSTTISQNTWNDNVNNPSSWYKNTENRYSDALDNYDKRLAFDSQTSSLYDIVKNAPVEDTSRVENKVVMVAETAPIQISMETEDYDENYTYNLENIDFGLIERPIQSMEVEKHVESLTIETAQGQLIGEAIIKEDGELEVTTGASITGGPSLGYVKSEMDAEIIDSGTIAKVGYNVSINNTSEYDYDTEGYYKFAIKDNSKIIKLKAVGVYDRLTGLAVDIDKNVDSDGNETWQILDKTDDSITYSSIFTSVGDRIYNQGNGPEQTNGRMTDWYEVTDEDGNTMLVREGMSQTIYENAIKWAQDSIISAKYKTVKEILNGEADVISKLNAEESIAAQDSRNYKFYGSSTISSVNEIRFDNTVEISDIQRDPDSKTGRIPLEYSIPYYEAEPVTITPPTGEDKDYVSIIVISISAIAVLGVGIVLIKKKVLKQ